MEAVRVQYSRSFGGYLLQTSGLLRASRLKRTRQGEKNSLAGSKKSFPRLKKRPAGLKKRFPGLKKSFEVEKKLSRVEKKLFPNQDPQEVIGHHLLQDLTEFRHLGEHSIRLV